ncbi:hypothetical protein SLEP1_g19651 [Rubroshorea leprosula]|uniref:Uncharacterized protein n=1 Tax=Rubroshorea leprosula TaxID=152421 RepID=A0AAV5J7N9_9ROSI|nr:hypothetical protein SLEP1_g19651 [Rubroshorea leprosula]
MGSCVSVEKSSEASDMKVRLPFGSKTENLTIPPSPVKEKQTNGDLPVISQPPPSTVKDFGTLISLVFACSVMKKINLMDALFFIFAGVVFLCHVDVDVM